jgi:hypothetical protein
MKKVIRSVFVTALILIPAITNYILADPPSPPGPGGSPAGHGGTPVGAPIDNGILILLILGVVYGAYKIYELRKAKSLEQPAK